MTNRKTASIIKQDSAYIIFFLNKHLEQTCQQSDCQDSSCRTFKRHPKECKVFKSNPICHYDEKCAYKHVQTGNFQHELNKVLVEFTEKQQSEINMLNKEIQYLKAKIEHNDLAVLVEKLCKDIHDLQSENEYLKKGINDIEEQSKEESANEESQDIHETSSLFFYISRFILS